MIKIIICESNASERQMYRKMLLYLAKKQEVDVEISEYESGSSLLIDVETRQFQADIVFLDIYMPFIDGMEAARKMREYGVICEIVFLTVSATHLLSAFDVGAFNYIIKGRCKRERFEQIFCKAIEKVNTKKQEYLWFKGIRETKVLRITEIRYFEVYKRMVTVHYGKEGQFEFQSSLEKMEGQLNIRGFLRVHRSFLVSMEHIEVLSYGELQLRDGTTIPIGRSYYHLVKETMQRTYGVGI